MTHEISRYDKPDATDSYVKAFRAAWAHRNTSLIARAYARQLAREIRNAR